MQIGPDWVNLEERLEDIREHSIAEIKGADRPLIYVPDESATFYRAKGSASR